MDELKEEFKELTRLVNNIDKKLEVWLQKSTDFFIQNEKEHSELKTSIKEVKNNHDGRLKKLEKWRYGLVGGMTVLLFLMGFMWDIIKDKF